MHIENLLFVNPEFTEQYNFRIEKGKNFLTQNKICIIGLTRNTSSVIVNTLSSLIDLGTKAKDYKIVLFENDSSDDTVKIINSLRERNTHIELLTEIYNKPQYGTVQDRERTMLLAQYRNKLKNYVNEHYSDYDFIVVADTDFQNFSLDGVYNSFGWLYENEIAGAICGNSFEYRPIFSNNEEPSLWNYDSWAYRASWWNNLQAHNMPAVRYNSMFWFGLQILPIGSHPFRINSGFGGMAIYRKKFYFSADYSGEDCEHVMFHYNLKQKNPDFHLFLNPSQRMLL